MLQKRIIILLSVVLLVVIGFSVLKPKINLPFIGKNNPTIAPLPKEEPTGTFVDGLLGDFVFFRDSGFYHVALPSRRATQLAGVAEDVVANFPHIRPAWSHDGKLFALAAGNNTVAVVDFNTGELKSRLVIDPGLDLSKEVILSFSPDDLYLLVKQNLNEKQSELKFFELSTSKLLNSLSDCSPVGFWMNRQFVYVTTCKVEDQIGIVTIDPYLQKDGVTKIASVQSYTLINEFDSETVLVKKGEGAGKLSLAGKYSALNSKSLPLGEIESFANLTKSLATKIMELKKTEMIDDLVIAPNNSFAIYHTKAGLWVIDLPIKSEPYFLFAGELPSIRPL